MIGPRTVVLALALAASAPRQATNPQQAAPPQSRTPQQARTSAKGAPAVDSAATAAITVQSWISRTAVWTGDAVDYSIRLVLAPGVQLAGDLEGENLSWAPFRLLSFSQTQEALPGGTTAIDVVYKLVPVDLPQGGVVQIPVLRVAYIAPGDRSAAGEEIPAREIEVTGPRVAYRSTLERPAEEATIRDGKELIESRFPGRTLFLLGIGGLLLGAYPFAMSGQRIVRRVLERRRRVDPRSAKRQLREELATLKQIRLAAPEDYERLYAGLYGTLRSHLSQDYGVTYPGLTSADADELRGAGVPDVTVERIRGFLRECEEVRYGSLSEDAEGRARSAVGLIEQMVAA